MSKSKRAAKQVEEAAKPVESPEPVKVESVKKQTRNRLHVNWVACGEGSSVAELAGAMMASDKTQNAIYKELLGRTAEYGTNRTNLQLTRSGKMGKLTPEDVEKIGKITFKM